MTCTASTPAPARRALLVSLACALASGTPALSQPPRTPIAGARQALDALAAGDPQTRLAAVLWLAEHGAAAQAERVAPRLHDDDPRVRESAEQAMWLMWSRSGDADVDRLLAQGTQRMNDGDLAAAIRAFDEVIRRRPDFAEGWNKRATALYLAGEYRRSLADCDEVMSRNPVHFGAMSGYGLIYLQLDECERALEFFRRALAVNPNMEGVRANVRGLERLLEQRRRRTI